MGPVPQDLAVDLQVPGHGHQPCVEVCVFVVCRRVCYM